MGDVSDERWAAADDPEYAYPTSATKNSVRQRCTVRMRHPQCWEHGCDHHDGCEVSLLIQERTKT